MVAALLQIAGIVAITAGALLLSIPAGLIVGGVLVILLGLAMEKGGANAG
jgi:hypothetical protein